MVAAILGISINNADREQFAASSEAVFHSRFTLQAMVDAYLEHYCNTAKGSRQTL